MLFVVPADTCIFFCKKAVIRLPFCLRFTTAKSFPTTFLQKKIHVSAGKKCALYDIFYLFNTAK